MFLWVPKTAGTSIWAVLAAHGGGRYLDPRQVRWEFPNHGLATFGHMSYPDLVAEGLISRSFDAGAYKFAVVRNPFDRVVSLFHYLRSTQPVLPSNIRFEEFTECLRERHYEPIGLYNWQGLSQCNPQASWLIDDRGRMIADTVGRFEDLPAFLDLLAERIGVRGALPHRNRSDDRKDYRKYYRSKVARRDIEAYAEHTLNLFSYSF